MPFYTIPIRPHEIYHSGRKGMKWGVRNGPPYPIDEHRNNSVVRRAIQSGEVSDRVNPDKQKIHNRDTHLPGRSYIYGGMEYAQELIDKYGGTGIAQINPKTGEWLHKERILSDDVLGLYINKLGEKEDTRAGMIAYSKTGSHIYPRKRGRDE